MTGGLLITGLSIAFVIGISANQPQAAKAQPRIVCVGALDQLTAADQAGIQGAGIHYDAPASAPTVACAQAIQAAKTWIGPVLAAQATQIVARNVLLTDNDYYSTDSQGQQHYRFQHYPVWVVTFKGLMLPNHGPAGKPIIYSHEENVVLDAATGEYLLAFVYQ
jgi:hypothetical protein